MKTEKIIWGLLFIFVGSIFLLDNFDVIEFYWGSVWRFWPLIFILTGVNMIFSRLGDRNAAPWLVAGVTVITLAFIGYQGSQPRSKSRHSFEFNSDRVRSDRSAETQVFTETMSDSIQYSQLNIEGGATSYILKDTTSNLFEARVESHDGTHSLVREVRDSVEVLNFHMRNGKRNWKVDDMNDNQTDLKLNALPVWDLSVKMGAGEVDFDLSSYKVRRLEFNGGAASFEAKLGNLVPLTDVEVEAGVASVEIRVPEGSGCRIKLDSGLSSKDFPGFDKQSDGSYTTSNYKTAPNKINISLKGGLSSFEVSRY